MAGNLRLKPDENSADGSDPQAPETFLSPHGEVTVKEHDAKAVLREIAAAWPGSATFEELLAQSSGPGAAKGLAEFLLGLYVGKFAHFRTLARVSAVEPGERPTGSTVARLQAQTTPLVTNLYHDAVLLEVPARHLLGLLDGSRDRAELRREMRAWITSGAAAEAQRQAVSAQPAAPGENEAETPPPSLDTLEADLDASLQAMVDLGLLLR